jgi:hypothetical protein
MSNFFKKFINGGTITPPPEIERQFFEQFVNPINVEWFFKETRYEAVFYMKNTEYIAHYSNDGLLIDYRINLKIEELPESIRTNLNRDEEIMNVVSIKKGTNLDYQLIVRDKNLTRYLIQAKETGEIISRTTL